MQDNFIIVKNEFKDKENKPDYRGLTKVGEKWEEIFVCWLKDGAKGKYFSCSKSKPKPESKPAETEDSSIPF